MSMPALLPRRPSRWTWPVAWSVAVVLVVAATLVPEAWWWLLIPDRDLTRGSVVDLPPTVQLLDVEILQPPPEITVVPPRETPEKPPPRPHVDPDWWTRSWNARIATDLVPARQTVPDTLLPRPLLDLLGAQATVDLVLMQPDSAVQAQLWWLVQEQQLTRNDLNGIYSAIARSRAYADLKSREAAMYDEFINETVPGSR